MSVCLHQTDLFTTRAQALLVTASTERPRGGRPKTDVLGTIGAQLLRRLDEPGREALADELDVPVEAGSVQLLELLDSKLAFDRVLVLGALGHLGGEHRRVIKRALVRAMEVARAEGLAHLALALPKGGWRTDAATAAFAVLDAAEAFPELRLDVHCTQADDVRVAAGILPAA